MEEEIRAFRVTNSSERIEDLLSTSGIEIVHFAINRNLMPCPVPTHGTFSLFAASWNRPVPTQEVWNFIEQKRWKAARYSHLVLVAPKLRWNSETVVALNSVWQDRNRYYAAVLRKIGIYKLDLEPNGGPWPARTLFLAEPAVSNPL